MAVYFVTGKLGSGKTLCAVGRAKEYLEQGRPVATNLDLKMDKLLPSKSKQTAIRLPDKPRLSDMELLGSGCVEEDESKYGLIILDELGTWFNSRNWRDKGRLELIDWFLHARKKHWDIFFIVQSIDSIDGQLISSLCEHLVVCRRSDRLKIPIIGSLLDFMGFAKTLPKIHVASVHYGSSESSPKVDRWVYRGKNLYNAYDTAQIFTDQEEISNTTGQIVDSRATYTLLSSFHTNHVQYCLELQNKINTLSNKKPLSLTQPAGGGGIEASSLQPFLMPVGFSIIFSSFVFFMFFNDSVDNVVIKEAKADLLNSPVDDSKTVASVLSSVAKVTFLDRLINDYRPRLASLLLHDNPFSISGIIEFYNNNQLVEVFTIKELHGLGVSVTRKAYGVDLVTDYDSYPVTAWYIPKSPQQQPKKQIKKSSSKVALNDFI